ncbi:MAG: exodeoxyribonuclease VII small subunit [Clostridia bacterium]|nr:exodeoxyribonuclease VII small subunit [Clostridia bacterium]
MSETQNTEKNTAEKKKTAKKEPKTFEAAIARLGEIVTALEDGTAPLDASLALYEEGVSLVRFCNEKLDAAEMQIKVLTRSADGEITEKDFTPET